MSGTTFNTVSPSISTTRRKTPWVDGCCGPMLTTMVVSPDPSTTCGSSSDAVETNSVIGRTRCLSLPVALHRIIFAQRMTFPLIRHHDAAQVRVPREAHAEEVEDLALIEVRRRPDRSNAVDHRIVARHKGPQPDSLLHSVRNDVVADLKARLGRIPIHR